MKNKEFNVREATTPNLDWVRRLPEVGRPITSQVEDIRNDLADARAAFDAAELRYAGAIDAANRRAKALEAEISHLWSAQEIDLARRGKLLIHGLEVDYE
jgi:hypothetical protein